MKKYLLFVVVGIVPVFFSIFPAEHFEFGKVMILHVVSLVLLAQAALKLVLAPQPATNFRNWVAKVTDDPIGVGMMAFLLSAIISTITSMSPVTSLLGTYESFMGLPTIASYAVLYFALRQSFSSREDARGLMLAGLFAAVIATAYALLQMTPWDPIGWSRTLTPEGILRPMGTIGHSIFLCAYIAMAYPILLYFGSEAASKKRWWQLALLVVIGLLMLLTAFLTQSRGSWIAMAAMITMVTLGLASQGWRRLAFSVIIPTVTVVAGLIAVFFLVNAPAETAFSKIQSSTKMRIGELVAMGPARLEYWKGGLAIFRKFPLFGSGVDTFQVAFQHQRSPNYWMHEYAGAPHRAHNELINIAATQGIFGLFAVLLLSMGIVLVAARAWRASSGHERFFTLSAASGLVAFYVYNISGFTVSSTATLAIALAAALSAHSAKATISPADESRSVSWLGQGLLLTAVVVTAIFWHNFLPLDQKGLRGLAIMAATAVGFAFAFSPYALRGISLELSRFAVVRVVAVAAIALLATAGFVRGIAIPYVASMAAKDGAMVLNANPDLALSYYKKAVTLEPNNEIYVMGAAYAAEAAMNKAETSEDRANYFDFAVRSFKYAIKLVPDQAQYYYSLGALLSQHAFENIIKTTPEQKAEALGYLEKAVRLEPSNPLFLAGLSGSAIALGDLLRARTAAERCVKLYPDYSLPNYHLGYILSVLGDFEKSAHYYEMALKGREFYGGDERVETKFTESDRVRAQQGLSSAIKKLGREPESRK